MSIWNNILRSLIDARHFNDENGRVSPRPLLFWQESKHAIGLAKIAGYLPSNILEEQINSREIKEELWNEILRHF